MTPPAPALVQADRVHGSLYTDPELFEQELTKIFESTWVWVAHDSELPKPGTFKSTYVGRQPVIVTRDRKGTVRTLLNRCRHRGASLCEKPRGAANGFTCPYHAWSYGLDGRLRGIPYPDGYEGVMEKSDLSLRALRTESYGGMIFASYDPDVEPLVDFLGDVAPWIDLFIKQGGGYPIKVLGRHQFTFKGNWKIQLENTTDGYHFPIVHRSWMASVDAETADMMSFMTDPECTTHSLGNGHSVMQMVPEHSDLDADDGTEPLQARFDGLVAELGQAGLDDAAVRRLVRAMHGTGFNLNLFPNVSMSNSFFRVLRPIAVDRDPGRAHRHRPRRAARDRRSRQPRAAAHPRALPGPVRVRHARRLGGLGAGAARRAGRTGDADHGQPRDGAREGRRRGLAHLARHRRDRDARRLREVEGDDGR